MERIGVRPSLDVNGIWGGYTGEGAKTIIPSKAHAKISMRLVPDQDYREIGRLFAEHFHSIAPRSVRVDVEVLHGGFPYVCPTDLPAYRAAARADRTDVRPEASAVLFGRQHPDHQHVREGVGRQVGFARIRARPRRDPLAERELRTRELPARHRDDRLVLPRVRGRQVNAVAPVYKSGHEVL